MDILLVEDDLFLSNLLHSELTDRGHHVVIAETGRQALQCVTDHRLDVVILDRMLPQVDGLSVLRRLREEGMTIPVIMLTAMGKSADKVEGLELGADDYVVKPVDVAELHARLVAVTRARQWTASGSDTICAGDITVSPARFRAWRNGVALDLRKLELKLLAELVRNADTILTRAMLYERVWNYDFEPKSNIADTYVRYLRQKLVEAGGDDPIITIRGVGYMVRR